MEIMIEGNFIKTERDFHKAFANSLGISPYYGHNLHALWDVLSAGVERPVKLIWKSHEESRKLLGREFDLIINVFQRVEAQDNHFGWVEQFNFILD